MTTKRCDVCKNKMGRRKCRNPNCESGKKNTVNSITIHDILIEKHRLPKTDLRKQRNETD